MKSKGILTIVGVLFFAIAILSTEKIFSKTDLPVLKLRKAEDRGLSKLSWLHSLHTFSFNNYYDPAHNNFGVLRVINEDRVKAGKGFGTHRHKNMEIISYVLDGELEHKDSMGNGSIIRPGDVQRMSAGRGVSHSEFNHSKRKEVHFLQIWFLPERRGVQPSYQQKNFSVKERNGKFRLVASREGRQGSVSLNQDVDMSVALLDNGQDQSYHLKQDRKAWIHIAKGRVTVNNIRMKAGDGLAVDNVDKLIFDNASGAQIIIFDMKER